MTFVSSILVTLFHVDYGIEYVLDNFLDQIIGIAITYGPNCFTINQPTQIFDLQSIFSTMNLSLLSGLIFHQPGVRRQETAHNLSPLSGLIFHQPGVRKQKNAPLLHLSTFIRTYSIRPTQHHQSSLFQNYSTHSNRLLEHTLPCHIDPHYSAQLANILRLR